MGSKVPLFNGLRHLPCPKEAGGATCSTPGCLFGHRSDNQSSNSSIRSRPHALDGAADGDAGEDSRPAPKRQRFNPTSHQQQVTNNNDPPTFAEQTKESDLYDPLSPSTVGDLPKEPPKAVTPSPLRTASTPPTHASQPQLLPQTKPATPHKPAASLASTPSSAVSNPKNTKHTSRSARPSAAAKPAAARSLASPLAHSSPAKNLASPRPEGHQSMAQDKASLARRPRKEEALNPRHLPSAPALHSVRHQLLKLLHIELVRLNGQVSARIAKEPELKPLTKTDQELIWTALDIEEKVAREKGPIYRNIMGQKVMAHKRMEMPTYIAECKNKLAQARDLLLRGGGERVADGLDKSAVQGKSRADGPVVINTGLTPSQEVDLLDRVLTPITNLEPYGYVSTPPTEEQITQTAETVGWARNCEQCDRCNAHFQVFPDGNIENGELTSGGTCTHHPGRAYYPQRPPGHLGEMVKKYRCCSQELNESPGCATTDRHVWKTNDPKRLAMLWNWVETSSNDSPGVKKAVAFDCEMGYTVHGMELVRLTATSWPDGAELIDVLVQPFGRILDLNSRYSGVFMEDLVRAVPWTNDWEAPPQKPGQRKIMRKVESPKAARDLLFSIISPDTVLIGHGLENDLNVMRMIHPKIVDTILLYPHRRGLPIRTSLKVLMDMHLRREIQIDTGNGHDSAEDARAAGDLVRLQVQNKWNSMSREGWQFLDGALRSPDWKREPTAPDTISAPAPAAVDSRSSEESADSEEGGVKLGEGPSDGGAKLSVSLLEASSSN